MPPKQVYGKRTAAKPSVAYAKFISPNEDANNLTAVDEVAITKVATRRSRTALKDGDANKMKRARQKQEEVDVGCLVAGMENLGVDENGTRAKTLSSQRPSPRRSPRKKIQDIAGHPENSSRERHSDNQTRTSTRRIKDAETTDLADEIHALNISEDGSTTRRTPRKRQDTSKSVKRTVSKPGPSKSTTIRESIGQTLDPEHKANQSEPATPVRARKLKAVVIPGPKSMSQVPDPGPVPDPEDPYTSHVKPLLSLQCFGKSIVPFQTWSESLGSHFTVTKIAEASFSEVYRLSATKTACKSLKESVLKLVPLRGPVNVPIRTSSRSCTTRILEVQAQERQKEPDDDDSWKSHVDDVYSEVKLLQNLNYIPGFTQFRDLTVLQGRPSKSVINAWKSWNKARPRGKKSEFPDPSKRASYDDTQLWAVIEMQDAGTDVEKIMEKGGVSTIWEAWDVFWGVCLSVAKAEEDCRFEHRDLHLENICIRSSRSESEADLLNPIIRDPLDRKFGFTGLETTVIDYTLSRADVSESASQGSSSLSPDTTIPETPPATPTSQFEVAYLDLNKDEALFAGDASEEYQYEIYRYMRGVVFHGDPLKSKPSATGNADEIRRSPRKASQHIYFDEAEPSRLPEIKCTDWSSDLPTDIWRNFHPRTNLVWAHFILYKLLEHLEGNEPTALSSKQIMRNVEVDSEEEGKVTKKAVKLYRVLKKVSELLEPSALAKKDSLGSMKELAVLAMEKRWLRVSDVAGS